MLTPNARKWLRRAVFLLLGMFVTGLAGWLLLWYVIIGVPGGADFYLHRRSYEHVVQTAKSLPVAVNTNIQMTLSGWQVFIQRDRSGAYLITMITKPWGHFGSYGYTYTDAILSSVPDGTYPQEKTLPGLQGVWFIDRQMDPHWWSVYNNLD